MKPVTVEIRSTKFKFQVRPLPNPLPMLGSQTSGNLISRELAATQTTLQTRFPEDFNFEADCQILDFHLTRFRPSEDPEDADNTGANFNPKTSRILEATQPGDRLFFYDIRVQCPGDKAPRMIDALSLRVR